MPIYTRATHHKIQFSFFLFSTIVIDVGRGEEVDDEIQQQQQQGSSSCSSITVDRAGRPLGSSSSSSPVDRPGRPLCTNVHKVVAVDRPVDRLKVPNSQLGTVDRCLWSVDRPVDRQLGRAVSGKLLN